MTSRVAILPPGRPMQSRELTAERLLAAGVHDAVAILGVRGYYRDTMGQPGANDRGIYDDAIFVFSTSAYAAFNANVDPSVWRPRIATLASGLWRYKVGTHGLSKPKAQQYTALVQAGEVLVKRDAAPGVKPIADRGWFGINIHRGGRTTTSSLGCQTIWPDQWAAFIALVQSELRRHAQQTIPYLLLGCG